MRVLCPASCRSLTRVAEWVGTLRFAHPTIYNSWMRVDQLDGMT